MINACGSEKYANLSREELVFVALNLEYELYRERTGLAFRERVLTAISAEFERNPWQTKQVEASAIENNFVAQPLMNSIPIHGRT